MTDTLSLNRRFLSPDELDIPRIPRAVNAQDADLKPDNAQGWAPCTPTDAGTEATMSVPSYWRGAINTRQALGDTGRGILLCAQIERDLIAGTKLSDIEAFREWREGVR